MEPELYKRITPIIHYKNKHSSLCKHVVIADSDGNLQKGVFTMQNTARDFGREISSDKSQMMAF